MKFYQFIIGSLLVTNVFAGTEFDCKSFAVSCWKSEKCMIVFDSEDFGKKVVMGAPFIEVLTNKGIDIVPITVSTKKILKREYRGHNRSNNVVLKYDKNLSLTSVKISSVQNGSVLDCGKLIQEQ